MNHTNTNSNIQKKCISKCMQSTIMLSRSLGTVQGYASWGVAKQGMQPGELAIISKEATRDAQHQTRDAHGSVCRCCL